MKQILTILLLSTSFVQAECLKDPPAFPNPTNMHQSVIAGETVECTTNVGHTNFVVWANQEMTWESCEHTIQSVADACGAPTLEPDGLIQWKQTGPNEWCLDFTLWHDEFELYWMPRLQSWDACAQGKE